MVLLTHYAAEAYFRIMLLLQKIFKMRPFLLTVPKPEACNCVAVYTNREDMTAHLSAHTVLWLLAVLACLTVVLYSPLLSRLWPRLTGTATCWFGRLPC